MTEIVGAFRKTSLYSVPRADDDDDEEYHPNSLAKRKYHELQGNSPRSSAAEPCPEKIATRSTRSSSRKLMSWLGFAAKGSKIRRPGEEDVELAMRMHSSSCSDDNQDRARVIRHAIDLATSLERIDKNFVITDPRLPDNPIVRSSI